MSKKQYDEAITVAAVFSVETAMKIALADRWNERAVILVDWAGSRQKGCMECSRAGKELDGQRSGRTFCSAGKFWLAEGVGKFLFGGQIFVLPANSCTGQIPVVGEFMLGRGKFLLGGQIHVLLVGKFLFCRANFCFVDAKLAYSYQLLSRFRELILRRECDGT